MEAAARKVEEIRRRNGNARIIIVVQPKGNDRLMSEYTRRFLTAGASDFLPEDKFLEEFYAIWKEYGPSSA